METYSRRKIMKKFLTAAAGLFAGTALMLAASPALARVDVDFHIGVPSGVYVQPAPVYVQPRPVYVQPQPVFVQPRPIYVHPQPVYSERQHHRHWRERRMYRDHDGDGVPNRYDRRPDNPYRY
jgi:hypothetical protein